MKEANEQQGTNLSLVQFICGSWMASNPALRSKLIEHCLLVGAIPLQSWPEVLDAASNDDAGQEAVIKAVLELGKTECPVRQWAERCCSDKSHPVSLRVRLHLALSGEGEDATIALPKLLQTDCEEAALAGQTVPPEAWRLLDAERLWPALLQTGACFAAAALLEAALPGTCPDCEGVTRLVETTFKTGRVAEARACCFMLDKLRGQDASAMLALLSTKQPFHLLEGLAAPSDDSLHEVAAMLALRYQDKRVHAKVLPLLSCRCALQVEVLQAVASGSSGAVGWWPAAAAKALHQVPMLALEPLLCIGSWSQPSLLTDALSAWLNGWDGEIAAASNTETRLQGADVLRKLRQIDATIARRAADRLLQQLTETNSNDGSSCDRLVLEALACGPCQAVSTKLTSGIELADASRQLLADLAFAVPSVASAGLIRDAATALWALKAVPGCQAEPEGADGFNLSLGTLKCGFIPWAASRAACLEEPSLSAGYPRADPDYVAGRFRNQLLLLGPFASSHAEPNELKGLLEVPRPSGSARLSTAEQLAWLEAARRLHRGSEQVVSEVIRPTALAWAAEPNQDRLVVKSAVATLAEIGGGPGDFARLAPSLKRIKGAAVAVAPLLDSGVPQELLSTVLASSSLSSAVASRQLARPHEHILAVDLLISLALHSSGRDSQHLAEDHPALYLCGRAEALSHANREALVTALLSQHETLPPEGSPHGGAHGVNLRFWLCLGSLLTTSMAARAAAAAEVTLRSGAALPATRVLIQNVWAQAAFLGGEPVLKKLTILLQNFKLPEALIINCMTVAAQLLLHPGRGTPKTSIGSSARLVDSVLEGSAEAELLAAMVGWSASYLHSPRLLASLALFHVLECDAISTPGWYLDALRRQLQDSPTFSKLRERMRVDEWVSSCWSAVKPSRPLDVNLNTACKQVSSDLWSPASTMSPECNMPADSESEAGVALQLQKRPERLQRGLRGEVEVVVCASLVDNVPNMAGIVRTSEALLGSRVEIALRNDKVLQDPHFQKMVVAADKSARLASVPSGPRLLAYLREHREQGRRVIALEQTSSSTILRAGTPLPKRFVLLLGGEQEGLPAWLLQSGLVDECVELPLKGCTGSLNVHVAASMLLWHYRLQH